MLSSLRRPSSAPALRLVRSYARMRQISAPEGHRPSKLKSDAPKAITGRVSQQKSSGKVSTSKGKTSIDGRIPVRDDHPLYNFFRPKGTERDENFEPKQFHGEQRFDTFDAAYNEVFGSGPRGRSWSYEELRIKSFNDLHVLWYLCLREKNLLRTQRQDMYSMGVLEYDASDKLEEVRKTMARIKMVLNERRIAFEGAVSVATTQREEAFDKEVMEYKQSQLAETSTSAQSSESVASSPKIKRNRWTSAQKAARREAQKIRAAARAERGLPPVEPATHRTAAQRRDFYAGREAKLKGGKTLRDKVLKTQSVERKKLSEDVRKLHEDVAEQQREEARIEEEGVKVSLESSRSKQKPLDTTVPPPKPSTAFTEASP